jgi:hypothetical protein
VSQSFLTGPMMTKSSASIRLTTRYARKWGLEDKFVVGYSGNHIEPLLSDTQRGLMP